MAHSPSRARAARGLAAVLAVLCTTLVPAAPPATAQGGGCSPPPVTIAPGQDLTGTLTREDCADPQTGFPVDVYTFEAVAGRRYTIGYNTQPCFAEVELHDPSGAFVAEGVRDGFFRSRIAFQAAATGTYRITATGSGAVGTIPSSYQIWLRDDDVPCDATARPIAPGQTLSGRLSVTDCYGAAMEESFTDLYTFQGAVGTEYTIGMNADIFQLDAFLALKDPTGAVVTFNNNGNGAFDAWVVWRPTVAGTYTIEVSSYDVVSRSRDGFGDYTVSLSTFTCQSQTTAIAPGQTLSGTLAETDCPSPHRPQFFDHYHDKFTFAAAAGETYEVVLSAEEYDPYVYLINPAGEVVAENNDGGGGWNSRLVFTAPAAGTYTIEATSLYYHQTGPYSVSLAVAAPCDSASVPIAPGQSIAGALAPTDCYGVEDPDSFIDRYTFAGAPGVEYTVQVTTETFELEVVLRDAAGREQYREGDFYLTSNVVFLFRPYRAETYTIEVTSALPSRTGPYSITLLANANDDCTTTTTPIAPDQTLSGALSTGDCYGTLRDRSYHDRYTFAGEAGEELTIEMRSNAFDAYVGLYGPDGALVEDDDDSGASLLDAKLEVTLPADGLYTIEATSYWAVDTGPYTVTLQSGIVRCEPVVVALEPGDTVDGALDSTDCSGAYGSTLYTDFFTFEATAGTPYVIRMSSPTFAVDPTLAIFDSGGSFVAADHDSGPYFDARILFTPAHDGVFTLEATSSTISSPTGPYTLSFDVYEGQEDCTPSTGAIEPGQTVEGELTAADCYSPNRDFCYHDRYTFMAEPGTVYTIDMYSDELDCWLVLVGPDGEVVAQDDDGGFFDARIAFEPAQAGAYTVEATTFATEESGPYTLALQSEPAEARGAPCAPSTLKVDPGQRIRNSLTTTDCYASERPLRRHDRYTLEAVAGAHYVVTMESDALDAYLVALDPSGAVVAENNDSGGKLDARVELVAASAGTYTLVATSNQPEATGRYDLVVSGFAADTVGVYVPATGAWFLRNSNSPGPADAVFSFGPGGAGLVPLSGDWNGDGRETAGVYDPATGAFFLRDANGPGAADVVFGFGAGGGLRPLVGDWDGDGDDTVGLYDPANGVFFLKNENAPGGADLAFSFGAGGGVNAPLAGDWDGDGDDTVGVYAAASGAFFLRDANASGGADRVFTFGPAGAGLVAVRGDWDADGAQTVGLYDPASGSFFLRDEHAGGPADAVFGYGPAGARPLAGTWSGR